MRMKAFRKALVEKHLQLTNLNVIESFKVVVNENLKKDIDNIIGITKKTLSK